MKYNLFLDGEKRIGHGVCHGCTNISGVKCHTLFCCKFTFFIIVLPSEKVFGLMEEMVRKRGNICTFRESIVTLKRKKTHFYFVNLHCFINTMGNNISFFMGWYIWPKLSDRVMLGTYSMSVEDECTAWLFHTV